ncbi:MAG: 3-deoxy-manno-octulosonate cytidylyltransferase [Deltaproteobacteria bacterium]|nr:3-deoxy-manno-octulosonate cytidylyltransferase [Deltaproteobacteria bacterium]
MKVLVFIPARYGSTRLEAKPLKLIKNKPMVEWVYEGVSKAKTPDSVFVATDDERIKKAVEAFGGKVVMTSPDCKTGTERVAEAAAKMDADIVVNAQGDEPLIDGSVIDACVAPFKTDKSLLLSTPVVKLTDPHEIQNPNVVKAIADKDGFAIYFSRSPIPYVFPGAPLPLYYKHIGVYAYKRDFLFKMSSMAQTPLEISERLEQLRVLENGYKIKLVETSYNPISVDTQEDLDKVRSMVGG